MRFDLLEIWYCLFGINNLTTVPIATFQLLRHLRLSCLHFVLLWSYSYLSTIKPKYTHKTEKWGQGRLSKSSKVLRNKTRFWTHLPDFSQFLTTANLSTLYSRCTGQNKTLILLTNIFFLKRHLLVHSNLHSSEIYQAPVNSNLFHLRTTEQLCPIENRLESGTSDI